MPVGLPTNRRHIAELLVAMGPKRAAAMLRNLQPDQVERVVADMATVSLSPEEAREVLKGFTRDLLARRAAPAGLDFARAVLSDLYGNEEARRISKRVDPRQIRPFLWLEELEEDEAASLLDKEPASTVALALAHLSPASSARILRRIAEPKRADVAYRVANLSVVAPDVVEAIKEQDGNLAGRIQEPLFVFDDLVILSDQAIQQTLKSIDTMDLAFALHSGNEQIRDLIFRNLSERARDSLKEEIDYLQSPKAAEVKAAKSRIIAVVRELEESGVIEIDRPGVTDDEDEDGGE
jgi:flagellar motor switch protein FliG